MPSQAVSFDPLARNFDRWHQLIGSPLKDYLQGELHDHAERAVDLGCGSGQHASLLASRYRHVLAVDISEPMLEIAHAHHDLPNITYQRRDLRELHPDTDGTFNLVFSAYALHHVPDLDQTLWRLRQLCAPWGRVVLVDNVAPTPAVSRRWFVQEALRTLTLDLLRHRRPVPEAWELFNLSTDPAWLDHLTSDRFLTPEEFAEQYGQVFPGARFTDLYRARAMYWEEGSPVSSTVSAASSSHRHDLLNR